MRPYAIRNGNATQKAASFNRSHSNAEATTSATRATITASRLSMPKAYILGNL